MKGLCFDQQSQNAATDCNIKRSNPHLDGVGDRGSLFFDRGLVGGECFFYHDRLLLQGERVRWRLGFLGLRFSYLIMHQEVYECLTFDEEKSLAYVLLKLKDETILRVFVLSGWNFLMLIEPKVFNAFGLCVF